MIYAFAAYAIASLAAIAYLLVDGRSQRRANNALVSEVLSEGKARVQALADMLDAARARDVALGRAKEAEFTAARAVQQLLTTQDSLAAMSKENAQHVHDKIASGSPAAAVAALNELFNKPLQAGARSAAVPRRDETGAPAMSTPPAAAADSDPRLPRP